MEKITIYTSGSCPYCKELKDFLEKEGVDFTEKLNTEFVDEWEEVTDLTGMFNVPTILFKDNYFVPGRDFGSPQQLLERINSFVPTSKNNERKILERLKTLTYNIYTAFGATDNILRGVQSVQDDLLHTFNGIIEGDILTAKYHIDKNKDEETKKE